MTDAWVSELLQVEPIDPPPPFLRSDHSSIAPVGWTGIQGAGSSGPKLQRYLSKDVRKAQEREDGMVKEEEEEDEKLSKPLLPLGVISSAGCRVQQWP